MRKVKITICILIAILSFGNSGWASTVWTGTGDWSLDSSNWSNGEPTSGDSAYIDGGASASNFVTITQSGEVCANLSVGINKGTGTINMTSGSLAVGVDEYIGRKGVGHINQSGGEHTVGQHWYLGFSYSGSTYNLSGGTLNITSNDYGAYIAWGVDGIFTQTGGTFISENYFVVGQSGSGIYDISGGTCTADKALVGNNGTGLLKITGDDATINVEHYTQNDKGTLESVIDADGISTINVLNEATLGGALTIVDSGAAPGTYTILSAVGGISGSFSAVNLPSSDWSYNIGANDLTVTFVPEPATIGLIAFGLAGLLRRRRA